MGMYGVMTREVCAWQPTRLLRKHFGVKDAGLEVPADTSGPSAQAVGLNSQAQRQQTNSLERRK